MDFYLIYWLLGIILLPGIIFASIAQYKINQAYSENKRRMASTNKTAEQVAREVLDKNGLQNITISRTSGELSDHYVPNKQNIALSEGVYGSNSVASLSIACHEVGHAIQTKEGYYASKIRTFLVPFVNFSSIILWPLIIIGMIFNVAAGFNSTIGHVFLIIGIVFFGLAVLFSLITLPTELDASKRALQQLQEGGYLITEEEIDGAKQVLRAAAMTYVASLVVAILNLVRFIVTVLIVNRE